MEILHSINGWIVAQVAPSIFSVIRPDGTLWGSYCYADMAVTVCERESAP